MSNAQPLRYITETPTDKQRNRVRASDLHAAGDALLIWVNEGDLGLLHITDAVNADAVRGLYEACKRVTSIRVVCPSEIESEVDQCREAVAAYERAIGAAFLAQLDEIRRFGT